MVVVGEVRVGAPLSGRTVAQIHDEVGVRVLRLKRGQEPSRDPKSTEKLADGDVAIIQAPFEAFRKVAGPAEGAAKTAG